MWFSRHFIVEHEIKSIYLIYHTLYSYAIGIECRNQIKTNLITNFHKSSPQLDPFKSFYSPITNSTTLHTLVGIIDSLPLDFPSTVIIRLWKEKAVSSLSYCRIITTRSHLDILKWRGLDIERVFSRGIINHAIESHILFKTLFYTVFIYFVFIHINSTTKITFRPIINCFRNGSSTIHELKFSPKVTYEFVAKCSYEEMCGLTVPCLI